MEARTMSTYPNVHLRCWKLMASWQFSLQERCSTWKAADATSSIWGLILAPKTGSKTCPKIGGSKTHWLSKPWRQGIGLRRKVINQQGANRLGQLLRKQRLTQRSNSKQEPVRESADFLGKPSRPGAA